MKKIKSFTSAMLITKRSIFSFLFLMISVFGNHQLQAQTDLGVVGVFAPTNPFCTSTGQAVAVTVKNYSAFTHDFSLENCPITVNISGASTQTFSGTRTVGLLAAGATVDIYVTLNGADFSVAGTHTFNAYTATVNDVNNPNNAMSPVNILVNPTPVATATPTSQTICTGGVTGISLSSSVGGSTFSWTFNQSGVTGASSSGGSSISQVLSATGAVPGTVTYTITPVANGCTGNPIVSTVTVNPAPTMTSASSATICSGATVNIPLTSNIASTYSWFANNNLNTTGEILSPQSTTTINNAITNSTAVAQVVAYSVTPSSAGCPGPTQTVNVTVNPAPNMTSASNVTVCSGVALNLPFTSSVVSTYTWIATNNVNTTGESTISQSTSTLNNTIVNTVATAQNVSYTVTPTSIVGACPGSNQTLIVTVNPTPISNAGPDIAICSGGIGPIGSSPVGGNTYSWSPSTGLSSTTISNPIASLLNGGTSPTITTYTVTTTNSTTGCISFDQVSVTVYPTPNMTSANSATICSGSIVNIPLTSTVASNFSWIAGDNINTTGESTTSQSTSTLNNTISNALSTAQTVSYTITPTSIAGGCPGPAQTVNVTVNPNAFISITSSPSTSNQTICNGTSITNITYAVSGGGSGATVSGLPSGVTGSFSGGTFTISGTATIAGTYNYTVTTTGTCMQTTATGTITVNPTPASPTVANNGPVCSGSSLNLTASTTAGAAYSWTGPNGFTSTLQNPIVSSNASIAMSGTYSVVISVSGCISSPASTNAVVNLPASAGFSYPSSSYCKNNTDPSPTLDAGATAGTFSATAGLSINSTSGLINLLASSPGTYVVTNTVAASGGCPSTSSTVNITINQVPVITNTVTNVTCNGACNGSISASVSGGTPSYIYSWAPSGGTASTASSLCPANYTVTVTDANGCIANKISTVTQPNVINITLSNTSATCNGACNGTASATVSGGVPSYAYSWSQGSITSSITGLCATSYTLLVTDAMGCTKTATTTINQPTVLSGAISPTDAICFGTSTGSITVIGSGGTPGYTYSIDGSTFQASGTFSTLTAGTYMITIKDANNCSVIIPTTVNQPADIIANFTITSTSCIGVCDGAVSASPTGGTGPYLYNWSPTPPAGQSTPTITNLCPGVYALTITDVNSCSAASNATITSPSSTISGHVTYSGGNLSSGNNTAALYKRLPVFTTFDTIQSTTLDALGNYNFTSVDSGNYIVKIFPDTSVYSTVSPTYYGNDYLWDSASVITQGCNSINTADITMLENNIVIGPGNISGFIIQGPGFGRAPGDPVPGIDVKLGRNPGGQMMISDQTDPSTGGYSFENIPVNTNSPTDSSYTIYVDIPGLERVSVYTFVVTGANNQFSDMDYYVDSTTIYISNSTVGIKPAITNKENKFNVYPNPSNGNTSIEYSITNDSDVSLEIYNVLGVKVAELVSGRKSVGTYKVNIQENNNLRSGIYFVRLSINGKANTKQLVITE